MTKYLACLLVLATSGCPDVKADSGEGVIGPMVEFDPAAQVLPFPNNLVLCATGTDASGAPCTLGKVAIPPPACETAAAKQIRTTTLNQLDGFGTFEAAMQVTFTKPVDPKSASDPTAYKVGTHAYIYQSSYGSPEVDQTQCQVEKATVAEDGLSVRLVVGPLLRGHIHTINLDGVRSAEGKPLLHPEAYYTMNYISKE